jgi:hypothetical protein
MQPGPEDNEEPVKKPIEPTFPSDTYIVEGEKIDIPRDILRDVPKDYPRDISKDIRLED